MAFPGPAGGGITIAAGSSGSLSPLTTTGYAAGGDNSLWPAIQTIWSKEILFQAMPILRFEQFAVKKTELGVMPGLTINFMRYNNLPNASQLVEGVRMQTVALTPRSSASPSPSRASLCR